MIRRKTPNCLNILLSGLISRIAKVDWLVTALVHVWQMLFTIIVSMVTQ